MGFDEGIFGLYSRIYENRREVELSLEDYLRRRTNISQWVPRRGLGRDNEHAPRLSELAALFPGAGGVRGDAAVDAYRARVEAEDDRVLNAV